MINLKNVTLDEYTFNEKNSSRGESSTRSSDRTPMSLAFDIKEIIVKEKTGLLKKISMGDTISFTINQEVEISYPNYRTKEYETQSFDVSGSGQGEVSEELQFDTMMQDDEVQEVTICLSEGYAERLE
jgi:hypothetical protein